MLLCKVVSIASGFDCADVVLVTAISEEQKAMKKCFGVGFETQLPDGIHYSVGTLKKNERFLRIAAVQPAEMGPVSAAVVATRAIRDWNPSSIVMTGICAGMEGMVRLGDLVVASQVFDHVAGTFRDGHLIPFQQSVSQEPWLLQFLGSLREDRRAMNRLFDSCARPAAVDQVSEVHVGAMASGSFVVKDAAYMRSLLDKTSKLLALDMESFGVASAAKMCSTLRRPVSWLVVKGVVDYGDALKGDDWHEYCCFVSAKFARLALELLLTRDKAYQFMADQRGHGL